MDGIHDYWRGGAGKHSACSDELYLVSEGNGKIIQREIPRIFMYGVFLLYIVYKNATPVGNIPKIFLRLFLCRFVRYTKIERIWA